MKTTPLRPDVFAVLLAAFFFVRGVAIQGLYPPLEGPDEYQHIAVIHYLAENRALPVYGKAHVPVSLYSDLAANPHPRHSFEQTARIGTRSYDTFYAAGPGRVERAGIRLYQAQHPPLYYLLMTPLYSWARSVMSFRATVYLLRSVNIAAAAAAVVLLLVPLRALLADGTAYRFWAAAAAASPMFMINVSRVANDACAMLAAGVAVALVLRLDLSKHPLGRAGAAGVCAALAMLCKLSGLVLLPAVIVYLLVLAAASRITVRRCAQAMLCFCAGYVIFSAPYYAWLRATYGVFIFDQLSQFCQASGIGLPDIVSRVRPGHFMDVFVKSCVLNNLWTSGWSFLCTPRFLKRLYGVLLLLSAAGCLAWLRPKTRTARMALVNDWPPLALCLLLGSATAGALYVFALKNLAVFGALNAPCYYFMIAYPAFMACMCAAATGWGRRAVSSLGCLLTLLFIFTELYGLLRIAAPYWAQAPDWPGILARLASVHPAFPSPLSFFILYPVSLVVLCAALFSPRFRALS